LAGVAESIPAALGKRGRDEALERITTEMRTLLASDVIYARGRAAARAVLAEEEIGGRVERSQFLPEPVEVWLDKTALTGTLSSVACDTGAARGVHGLELVSTTVTPGNT